MCEHDLSNLNFILDTKVHDLAKNTGFEAMLA